MKIQDLENRTGLERPTIRFYEREGLLQPKRLENGYRDYSETDAALLLKIKLLRQLGFSLEKIKALQQGSVDFSAALSEQIARLASQIDDHKRSRAVCQQIQKDGVGYANLDGAHYLQILRTIPIDGRSTGNYSFQESLPKEIHPWRRFFARTIDYTLFGSLLNILLFVIFRIRPLPGDFMQAVLLVITGALFVPVEALLLHFYGTTPGKLAMGIRIEYYQGGTLPMWAALDRAKQVFIHGEGIRIPLLSLAFNHVCYCRLTGRAYGRMAKYNEIDPPTEMDWDTECELIYTDWDRKQITALTVAILLWAIMVTVFVTDAVKPKYRSDLTIAQFAENYNFYYGSFNTDIVTQSERLQPDGSFYPESDQNITIYINGEPEKPQQPFTYETQNGIIKSIHYENTWTDVFYINPIPNKCMIASTTLLMSQKGNGIQELFAFEDIASNTDFTQDGSLTYGGIELRWQVQTENCKVSNGHITRSNENNPSSVTIKFEARILQ